MNRHDAVTAAYEVPGQTWPSELCWLYDMFSKSKKHVEIGTYCGRSLAASIAGMSDATVSIVDNESEWPDKDFTRSILDATIRRFCPSTVTVRKFDDSLSASLAHESVESVFIDGCHEYAECKADIQSWMPKLISGGIISGHDYWSAHVGVMDAVNEIFGINFVVVPKTRIWFVRL